MAPVYEIFSSWQGEGLFAGRKQIFVRFSGCNLDCSYCDEPASVQKAASLTPLSAVEKIKKLSKEEGTRFVSFTGGEPLLYADFIKAVIPGLGPGFSFFLETNGSLPGELKKVISGIGVVSMDMKLPFFCGKALWLEHREFLKLAADKAYVKIVVSPRAPLEEFERAVKIIAGISRDIPLFIQPESSGFLKIKRGAPVFGPYKKFYEAAALRLGDVSLLPQLHKIWGAK